MAQSSSEGESSTAANVPHLGNITAITKLNKTNYKDWLEDIEIELKLRGVYKAIETADVEEMIELQARRIILETMDKEHRAQVRGYGCAKDIMERLKISYAEATDARKYRLLVKFFRYNKLPEDNIDTHVGKIEGMRADLKDLDFEIDEEIMLATIIGSLPPEYGNVMETWELAAPDQKTKANLIAKLLNKEADMKTNSSSHVFPAIKPRMTKEEIERKKKVTRCGMCKEIGHWHAECPKKKHENEKQMTKNIVLNVITSSLDLKEKWIIDSGASSNMCNNAKWFKKLHLFKDPLKIKVGDGNEIDVIGIGEIEFTSHLDKKEINGTLTSVFYIPKLAANLISVGAVSKRGITVTFNQQKCEFIRNREVVLTGSKVSEDLYVLNLEVNLPRGSALITKLDRTSQEWHDVLGHHSDDKIKILLNDLKLKVRNRTQTEKCANCPGGKGKKVSHPEKEDERAELVGKKVHIDLVHIGTDEACNYYLFAKDEASEYCFVYFVHSKTEVCESISKLVLDFEIGSGCPIQTIQSDNGSEFINKKVKNLLDYERINHETSTAYVPQQNGIIERAVQTLNNSARTMLLLSKLPKILVCEAIRTACYLQNRVPTTRSSCTPFERFTGRKPYIGHLVRFGEPGHMLINHTYVRKFDARTLPCFTVGYTARRNTYRVYVPSIDRVVESCDIIFRPHKTENDDHIDHDNQKVIIADTEELLNASINSEIPGPQPSAPPEDQNISSTHETVRIGKNNKPYVSQEQLCRFFEDIRAQTSSVSSQEEEEIGYSINLPQNETTETGQSNSNINLLYLATNAEKSDLEPKTYDEAVQGPNRHEWVEAINKEKEAHEINDTWRIVDRPKSGTVLTAKWIFKIKRNSMGEIERYKARLVARGYEQRAGIDFKETFAPVASIETIRTIFGIATTKNLAWVKFDITTAFLNGKIEDNVYIEPPQGLDIDKSKCLKLNKALYGLKQAPRAWSSKFTQALKSIGFHSLISDPCLFANNEKDKYIITYVDDGVIFCNLEKDCHEIIQQLNKHFTTNVVNGSVFLGIELIKGTSNLQWHQKRYIEEMLTRFNMSEAEPVKEPIVNIKGLTNDTINPQTTAPYREAIGALLYLALNTRPDILYPTITLSRYNNHPTTNHWHRVQRLMRYVKGTKDLALTYTPSQGAIKVEAFADADWGGIDKGASTSGILVKLNDCSVIMKSIRQKCIALSTCEAEYVATSECLKEIMWITNLLDELKIKYLKPVIYVDNKPTIETIKGREAYKGIKHISLRYNFLKTEYKNERYNIEHINTVDQEADIFTKEMTKNKLDHLLPKLGLKMKTVISLALLLCLYAPYSSTEQINIVNYVEWIPSKFRLIDKTVRHTVRIPIIDRCYLLKKSFGIELDSDERINKIIKTIVDDCNRKRTKIYLPVIYDLQNFAITHATRLKRETNLGRPLKKAQSAATFYASILLPQAQMISQYESPDSAYNTVWQHEELLDRAFGQLNDHEKRFKEVQSGNEASLKSIKTIIE